MPYCNGSILWFQAIVKVILKHCFDDKEDISAMAKGNSLDKLVEKVMELIREVYL